MMPTSGDAIRSEADRSEIRVSDVIRLEPDPPDSLGAGHPDTFDPDQPGALGLDHAESTAAVAPVWAGIVVGDLERSVDWYAEALGTAIAEHEPWFALVRFSDGSILELVAGDPQRPGSAFPSYRNDPGPPVMPGFRVTDPAETGRGMLVARWLPEWVVVVGPGGLRTVLCRGEGEARTGLVGFDVAGPDPERLTNWFGGFGAPVTARVAPCLQVVPVVAGLADADLVDPDGTALRLTS